MHFLISFTSLDHQPPVLGTLLDDTVARFGFLVFLLGALVRLLEDRGLSTGIFVASVTISSP